MSALGLELYRLLDPSLNWKVSSKGRRRRVVTRPRKDFPEVEFIMCAVQSLKENEYDIAVGPSGNKKKRTHKSSKQSRDGIRNGLARTGINKKKPAAKKLKDNRVVINEEPKRVVINEEPTRVEDIPLAEFEKVKDVQVVINGKPMRVKDIPLTDYEKVGIGILGQCFRNDPETIPLKKRRISCLDSSLPHSVDINISQHVDQAIFAADGKTNLKDEGLFEVPDFFYLSILADVACLDDAPGETVNADCLVLEKHHSDEEAEVKEKLLSTAVSDTKTDTVGALDSAQDTIKIKDSFHIDRSHWDLNTPMEEWEISNDGTMHAHSPDLNVTGIDGLCHEKVVNAESDQVHVGLNYAKHAPLFADSGGQVNTEAAGDFSISTHEFSNVPEKGFTLLGPVAAEESVFACDRSVTISNKGIECAPLICLDSDDEQTQFIDLTDFVAAKESDFACDSSVKESNKGKECAPLACLDSVKEQIQLVAQSESVVAEESVFACDSSVTESKKRKECAPLPCLDPVNEQTQLLAQADSVAAEESVFVCDSYVTESNRVKEYAPLLCLDSASGHAQFLAQADSVAAKESVFACDSYVTESNKGNESAPLVCLNSVDEQTQLLTQDVDMDIEPNLLVVPAILPCLNSINEQTQLLAQDVVVDMDIEPKLAVVPAIVVEDSIAPKAAVEPVFACDSSVTESNKGKECTPLPCLNSVDEQTQLLAQAMVVDMDIEPKPFDVPAIIVEDTPKSLMNASTLEEEKTDACAACTDSVVGTEIPSSFPTFSENTSNYDASEPLPEVDRGTVSVTPLENICAGSFSNCDIQTDGFHLAKDESPEENNGTLHTDVGAGTVDLNSNSSLLDQVAGMKSAQMLAHTSRVSDEISHDDALGGNASDNLDNSRVEKSSSLYDLLPFIRQTSLTRDELSSGSTTLGEHLVKAVDGKINSSKYSVLGDVNRKTSKSDVPVSINSSDCDSAGTMPGMGDAPPTCGALNYRETCTSQIDSSSNSPAEVAPTDNANRVCDSLASQADNDKVTGAKAVDLLSDDSSYEDGEFRIPINGWGDDEEKNREANCVGVGLDGSDMELETDSEDGSIKQLEQDPKDAPSQPFLRGHQKPFDGINRYDSNKQDAWEFAANTRIINDESFRSRNHSTTWGQWPGSCTSSKDGVMSSIAEPASNNNKTAAMYDASSVGESSGRSVGPMSGKRLSSLIERPTSSSFSHKKNENYGKTRRHGDEQNFKSENANDGRSFRRERSSSRVRDRGRGDDWVLPRNSWDPDCRDSSGYYGQASFTHHGPKNAVAAVAAKLESNGFAIAPDGTILKVGGTRNDRMRRQSVNSPSQRTHRADWRRPLAGSNGSFDMPKLVENQREMTPDRFNSPRPGRIASRVDRTGRKERYHAPMPYQQPFYRREQSYSPVRANLSHSRTRSSKSRTRSPRRTSPFVDHWTDVSSDRRGSRSPPCFRSRRSSRSPSCFRSRRGSRSPSCFRSRRGSRSPSCFRSRPGSRSPSCFRSEIMHERMRPQMQQRAMTPQRRPDLKHVPGFARYPSPLHPSRQIDEKNELLDHFRGTRGRNSSSRRRNENDFPEDRRFAPLDSPESLKPDKGYTPVHSGRFPDSATSGRGARHDTDDDHRAGDSGGFEMPLSATVRNIASSELQSDGNPIEGQFDQFSNSCLEGTDGRACFILDGDELNNTIIK